MHSQISFRSYLEFARAMNIINAPLHSRGPSWQALRELQASKAFRGTGGALIATPVLARSLNQLAMPGSTFYWLKDVLPTLPTTFILAFFAGLLAVIAAQLYRMGCPKLIRNYPTYESFEKRGYGMGELRDEFASLLRSEHVTY